MADFQPAAKVADIPEGSGAPVSLGNRTVAIFNVGGTFLAVDNACVHRGGPLGEGALDGAIVSCPFHGWQYDLRTGACVNNPAAKVKTYPVKVEGADLLVDLG